MLSCCMSIKRLVEFFLSLAMVAVAGTSAAADSRLMRTVPVDRELQFGLVAAGALNKRPNLAKNKDIRRALKLWGAIYGTRDTSTKELALAESQRILDMGTSFRSLFDIAELDGPHGTRLLVPRLITSKTSESGDTEHYYRSTPENVLVYAFKFQLRKNPPFEMLRDILLKARDANIGLVTHTDHDFLVELTDAIPSDPSGALAPRQRNQHKLAFASGDKVYGFYISYLSTPPQDWKTPDFLRPLIDYWTPPAEILDTPDPAARRAALSIWMKDREISDERQAELLALMELEPAALKAATATLLDHWSWQHAMRTLAVITGSEFEEKSRWSRVSVGGCYVEPDRRPDATTVRIIFATNRATNGDALGAGELPQNWFTSSSDENNTLRVGCASVAVPKSENPKISFGDPPKVAGVSDAGSVPDTPTFSVVKSKPLANIDVAKSAYEVVFEDRERWLYNDETRALVFVHGYNTPFEYALLRAAQIAVTTGYRGRVFLFSWPSAGWWPSYLWDMDSAERSELQLSGFLRAILRDPEVQRLDLVAHSMGSQMLLRSLGDLRDVFFSRDDIRLGQVVFAAPDLSTDVFAAKIRETTALAEGISIYGSEKDKALLFSSKIRGAERLGLIGGASGIELPGLAYYDATTDSGMCDFWGLGTMEHSYFVDSPNTLKHMAGVLKRTLRKRTEPEESQPTSAPSGTQVSFKPIEKGTQRCWWEFD
ncbi:MAG: hypothetical protein B7Y80_19410 [Hyphomicrobium sp. 32-62-53]|nr:MAG: hypothetical protein B7Z29_16810 [Hyphomicrobium sp. 12-62-95]OYX97498.1 MAG: hypothetical protein B7Y80_19410 [Hyphomicrobium sp. 32-62-53]